MEFQQPSNQDAHNEINETIGDDFTNLDVFNIVDLGKDQGPFANITHVHDRFIAYDYAEKFHISSDQGTSWVDCVSPIPTSFTLKQIVGCQKHLLMFGTKDNVSKVLRFTVSDTTLTLADEINLPLVSITSTVTFASDSSHLNAIVDIGSQNLVTTVDGGVTWTLHHTAGRVTAVTCTDNIFGYVATVLGVNTLVRSDNGVTWDDMPLYNSAGQNVVFGPTSIVIGTTAPYHILIAGRYVLPGSRGGLPGYIITTNGGNTWAFVKLPSVYHSASEISEVFPFNDESFLFFTDSQSEPLIVGDLKHNFTSCEILGDIPNTNYHLACAIDNNVVCVGSRYIMNNIDHSRVSVLEKSFDDVREDVMDNADGVSKLTVDVLSIRAEIDALNEFGCSAEVLAQIGENKTNIDEMQTIMASMQAEIDALNGSSKPTDTVTLVNSDSTASAEITFDTSNRVVLRMGKHTTILMDNGGNFITAGDAKIAVSDAKLTLD